MNELTDNEVNELRIRLLEYFSGKSKSFTELLESCTFNDYVGKLGDVRLRDFLAGLCDPAGFIYYHGSTRNRQYKTTRFGRSMIPVYRGEFTLPDPDDNS